MVAQLVLAICNEGIAQIDNANALLSELQAGTLVVHELRGLRHQVDIDRRARNVKGPQAIVTQRVSGIAQTRAAQEGIQLMDSDGIQRDNGALRLGRLIDIQSLTIAVPDQRHLPNNTLQRLLRCDHRKIAADGAPSCCFAENDRLIQRR
ncbi:hypothetical protein D3C81_1779060 [compost metagenome]